MSVPARKIKRSLSRQQVAGTADVLSTSFMTNAGVLKSAQQYGPEFKKTSVGGMSAIIATSPSTINPGTPIAVYNNTSSVQWLNMNRAEDGSLVAPSGLSNAIPLKPNDWTYLNMGENDTVQVSSASVGIYILTDNSTVSVLQETDPF